MFILRNNKNNIVNNSYELCRKEALLGKIKAIGKFTFLPHALKN